MHAEHMYCDAYRVCVAVHTGWIYVYICLSAYGVKGIEHVLYCIYRAAGLISKIGSLLAPPHPPAYVMISGGGRGNAGLETGLIWSWCKQCRHHTGILHMLRDGQSHIYKRYIHGNSWQNFFY